MTSKAGEHMGAIRRAIAAMGLVLASCGHGLADDQAAPQPETSKASDPLPRDTGPLAPGHAAGTPAAAQTTGTATWILGIGAAIAGGTGLALSGSDGAGSPVQPQTTTVTTTTGSGH